MYDVAVIGAGPAGAVAAKRLAENGLQTVLLEKRFMPRDKICSGFLMDAWPLVVEEFGRIPAEVLCAERQVSGITLHVPGAGTHSVDRPMATAWRAKLDYWLATCALGAGADLFEGSRLMGLSEVAGGYELRLRSGEREETLQARYVVGADGTASTVRKWLYPDLKVVYSQAAQEAYATRVELPPDRMNLLLFPEFAPFYFDVHYKDGLVVMECGCRLGEVKALMGHGRRVLAEGYGFDAEQRRVKNGACTEPVLYAELFSGRFRPARGNVLLVGDAAGLLMPVTGEGILGGIRSGQLAAEAILSSNRSGVPPAEQYLTGLADTVGEIKAAFDRVRAIRQASRSGPAALLAALTRAWEETITGR